MDLIIQRNGKKKSGNNRSQVQWSDRDVEGKRRDVEGMWNGPGTSVGLQTSVYSEVELLLFF